MLNMEYIITLLPPYYKNLSTELRKSKKLYFYDNGVPLLLSNERADRGALLENTIFIALQRKFGEENLRYWRTQSGAEVDFVVLEKGLPKIAIEVKSSAKRSKALWNFMEVYGLEKGVIVDVENEIVEKKGKKVLRLQPWWV